jgi:hypothetical protein
MASRRKSRASRSSRSSRRFGDVRETVIDLEPGDLRPQKQGYVRTSEARSTKYAVFDRAKVEQRHGPITPKNKVGIATALTGWRFAYRGAGRAFCDEPKLKVVGAKVMVTADCGVDI